jgi:hypothetical protein
MKFTPLIFLFAAFITEANAALSEKDLPGLNIHKESNQLVNLQQNDSSTELVPFDSVERDLQSDTDGPICNFIESAIFRNNADCSCNLQLLQASADFSCVSEPICSPIGSICGSIKLGLLLSLQSVAAEMCIQDIKVGLINLDIPGPFCIEYTTQLFRSAMKKTCPNGYADCFLSGKAETSKQAIALVDECTATIGGEECSSCTPCNKKGAVKFDCSNIVENFKVDRCAKFPVWLGPGSSVDPTKLPDIVLSS